ncbi:hypothetical protein SprV_0902671500 [Sparganum proliferum]
MSLDLHRLRKSYQNFQICCAIAILICLLVGPLLILAGIVTCVVDEDRTAQIVALGLMIIGVCLAFGVFGIARMINNEVSFSDSDPGDIQQDLAIETVELLLRSKYNETENRLGHAQVLQLLKFCLKTYFTFDGTIYEQVKGTPMSSPISGFIAEAVLQRLESLVFQQHRPKFWARYVDDTFVVIERDQVLTFKERLNSVFPNIQFTMEEEENNQLTFLDVLSTTILAAYEGIQEGQLVVLFLLHRKLCVRKDRIQTFLECQRLIPVDNDEGIVVSSLLLETGVLNVTMNR